MTQEERGAYPHIPNHLFPIIKEAYNQDTVYDLFDAFFPYKTYDRNFSIRLMQMIQEDCCGFSDTKSLAILILENQILKLAIDQRDEFDFLLARLNLKSPDDHPAAVHPSVLLEGYSTTALPDFIVQFKRRLARLRRVHEPIRGDETSASALRNFIRQSRLACKLTLARYLVTPDEVVDHILPQVRRSTGLDHLTSAELVHATAEATRRLAGLPAYERRVLHRLRATADIYWVSASTSSELNAMVEYPLTTVAMVVKPPGSDLEFEVKRTGVRGRQALQIVYEREGRAVPPSHRLHGGSMGRLLNWEAHAAALFAIIYRGVHRREAPLSITVAISAIYTIPVDAGEAYITDYLTDARVFGDGFGAMRTAMSQSVQAYDREHGDSLDIPGELGLTLKFISHIGPRQSILVGSSSFRIDRLARYLSAQGPETYFTDGLQAAYGVCEAQWFADDLLEEILAVYTPPEVAYDTHVQYIHAALSMPVNRARADRHYLAIMQQLGTVWGTLLALHGHSRGESFVARNVGLKSVWEQGQWQTKIIFMDHDDLHIMGTSFEAYRPRAVLYGMRADEQHIRRLSGELAETAHADDMGLLADIYQVSSDTWQAGKTALRQAMMSAHQATGDAVVRAPNLSRLFDAAFLQRIQDWDCTAASYMALESDASQVESWKMETKAWLATQNYHEPHILEYIESVESYREFLARYPFVYRSAER